MQYISLSHSLSLISCSLSLSLFLSFQRQFIYQMCEELLQLCKGLIVSSFERAHKMLKLVTQFREYNNAFN